MESNKQTMYMFCFGWFHQLYAHKFAKMAFLYGSKIARPFSMVLFFLKICQISNAPYVCIL